MFGQNNGRKYYGCKNSNFDALFFHENNWFQFKYDGIMDKFNTLSHVEWIEFLRNLYPDTIQFEDDNIEFKGIKKNDGIFFSWFWEEDQNEVTHYMKWNQISYELIKSIRFRFYDPLNQMPSEEELSKAKYSNYEDAKEGLCITNDEFLQILKEKAGNKIAILRHFNEPKNDRKKDSDFLKDLFGTGGTGGGFGFDICYSPQGFQIQRNRFIGDYSCTAKYSWSEVANAYEYMIANKQYFTAMDFENYMTDIRWDAKRKYEELHRNYIEIPRTSSLSVEDEIYVNGNKCQVLGIDHNIVSVCEVDFPLFVDSYEIPELNDILRKDSRNHLDREMTASEFYEASYYSVIGFLKESSNFEEYVKNRTDIELYLEDAIEEMNDSTLYEWYRYSYSFKNYLIMDVRNSLMTSTDVPLYSKEFEDTSPFLWSNRIYYDYDYNENIEYIKNYINEELSSEKNEVLREFLENDEDCDELY